MNLHLGAEQRMRILVTGGAGYIGSHAVLELLDAGYPTVVIDNLVTGFRWAVDPRATFVAGAIEDDALVRRTIHEHGVGGVLHFAGSTVAPESVACPGIVSISPEQGISAAEIGDELEMRGFWLSYRSSYLLQRNWIQIALLGDPARASTEKLLRVLRIVCGRREPRRLQPAQAASHSA